MKYAPYTLVRGTKAAALLGALKGHDNNGDRTVYVIGVSDHVMLAALLSGNAAGPITEFVEEVGDIVAVAQAVKFIECIGTPTDAVSEAQLIELAKKRIEQLEEQQ
jgi:hypothetical protein